MIRVISVLAPKAGAYLGALPPGPSLEVTTNFFTDIEINMKKYTNI